MDPVVNIAKLLADNSRVKILTALMSDKALTPGELAIIVDITPQTVSSHLSKLEHAKLITYIAASRHKYYYLASDKIAELLESLYQLAPMTALEIPFHQKIHPKLKEARTCYKHLAGKLAVTLTSNMLKEAYLSFDGQFQLTEKGQQLLLSWGYRPLSPNNYVIM